MSAIETLSHTMYMSNSLKLGEEDNDFLRMQGVPRFEGYDNLALFTRHGIVFGVSRGSGYECFLTYVSREDFYEGLSLYERFISSSERRFEEQDFLTDTMRQISDLQNTVQQLTLEKQQLKQQIETMSKTPKHQTTVYNYGTYNDIHDNPHATIYATAPQDKQPDSILPPENDYTALVRWLEFEKLRGNDYYAEADCNRTKLCRNLLKIIGWEPNQDSLRKAQNR